MEIKRTYPFWTWLCRFAYKQIKKSQKFTGIGVPGIRDKENPCEWYSPRKRVNNAQSDCQSDGHYLCKECAFYDKEQTI